MNFHDYKLAHKFKIICCTTLDKDYLCQLLIMIETKYKFDPLTPYEREQRHINGKK